uniref:DUF1409 domain-containing protein n=1 Tax=Oryza brachyantha TaxID=4533 RepID=J3KUX6_ORYBR
MASSSTSPSADAIAFEIPEEFDDWWSEICQHLFAVPVGFYRNRIDSDYTFSNSKASLAAPTITRSGRPIEYSTFAIPALGHCTPSPSEYIKNFTGPPSPPRKLKRKNRTNKPTTKIAKITAEAVPLETSFADMDAAVDAAADKQSDNNTDQTTDPQPPPASTTTCAKYKVITHRPFLRRAKVGFHAAFSFYPSADTGFYLWQPSVASATTSTLTPLVDTDLEPIDNAEEMITPTPHTIQPADAIPGVQDLDDFFSFNVSQYFDPSEAGTDAFISLPADIKERLTDILARLDYPIDTLINNAGSIRSRIEEIQDRLPDDLIDAIAPAGYIESHRFPMLLARQRIANHACQVSAQVKVQTDRERAVVEKARLDELQSAEPAISANIADRQKKKADLEAQLAKVMEKLAAKEEKMANLPSAITT